MALIVIMPQRFLISFCLLNSQTALLFIRIIPIFSFYLHTNPMMADMKSRTMTMMMMICNGKPVNEL